MQQLAETRDFSAARRYLLTFASVGDGADHLASWCGAPVVAGDVPRSKQSFCHRMRAHVEFLADDLMEGREAGTRGYDVAAHYVATVMKSAGLEPAADDGTVVPESAAAKEHARSERAPVTRPGGPGERHQIPEEGVVASDARAADLAVTARSSSRASGSPRRDLATTTTRGSTSTASSCSSCTTRRRS